MPLPPRVVFPLLFAVFAAPVSAQGAAMSPTLTSAAFSQQGAIPSKYTCEGADLSPPLSWTGLPPGTRSLALVVDDPDAPDPAAPKMTWVHWVLYDLPRTSSGLEAGVTVDELPEGTL